MLQLRPRVLLLLLLAVLGLVSCVYAEFRAGAAIVDATMPTGTPLAGLGSRHWEGFPKAKQPPGKYTDLMMASEGRLGGDINDGTYVRALVLDDGKTKVAIVTLDTIGAEGALMHKAWLKAKAGGFPVAYENCQFSASHTHSGPGAMSRKLIWEIGAVDTLHLEIEELMIERVSEAMIRAAESMLPAVIGFDNFETKEFTVNRRAGGRSPYVKPSDVDSNFGIARIDALNGVPIATLWNLAIHGTCLGTHNLLFSGDIAGRASLLAERQFGGAAMFINADAGDIKPGPGMCDNKPDLAGSHKLSAFLAAKRPTIATSKDVALAAHSHEFSFGPANLNLTLERAQVDCEKTPDVFIELLCKLGKAEHLGINPKLDDHWVANTPRFSAFRFTLDGTQHVAMTSFPGEAIQELGYWIRGDVAKLGFDNHFFAGYSNEYMAYVTTPREYIAGGYEAVATFFGIDEAKHMREQVLKAANAVKP